MAEFLIERIDCSGLLGWEREIRRSVYRAELRVTINLQACAVHSRLVQHVTCVIVNNTIPILICAFRTMPTMLSRLPPKLFYSEFRSVLKCYMLICCILKCVISDWLSPLSLVNLHLRSLTSLPSKPCVLRNTKPLRSSLAQVPGALELHHAMRDWIAPTIIILRPRLSRYWP
jgi:hypothetical protein